MVSGKLLLGPRKNYGALADEGVANEDELYASLLLLVDHLVTAVTRRLSCHHLNYRTIIIL